MPKESFPSQETETQRFRQALLTELKEGVKRDLLSYVRFQQTGIPEKWLKYIEAADNFEIDFALDEDRGEVNLNAKIFNPELNRNYGLYGETLEYLPSENPKAVEDPVRDAIARASQTSPEGARNFISELFEQEERRIEESIAEYSRELEAGKSGGGGVAPGLRGKLTPDEEEKWIAKRILSLEDFIEKLKLKKEALPRLREKLEV